MFYSISARINFFSLSFLMIGGSSYTMEKLILQMTYDQLKLEHLNKYNDPVSSVQRTYRTYEVSDGNSVFRMHFNLQSRPVGNIKEIEVTNSTQGKTTFFPTTRKDIFVSLITTIKKLKSGEFRSISCIHERKLDGNKEVLQISACLEDEETNCSVEYPHDLQLTIRSNK